MAERRPLAPVRKTGRVQLWLHPARLVRPDQGQVSRTGTTEQGPRRAALIRIRKNGSREPLRPPDGRKKAVLRLKSRAQIPRNTLDISAFSAERLSDASWIVHGSDYHHFRPRRRLLPARPAQGHHRRHRVPAGDDLLSPALRRADGERG